MHSRPAEIPIEIGRAQTHDVRIVWKDGHESIYPARGLRLRCPCAQCVNETTGKRQLNPAQIPKNVYPLQVQLVGRYAISLHWSDGHQTGIYPFQMLRAFCPCCHPQEAWEPAQDSGMTLEF